MRRMSCGCPASKDDAENVYVEGYDPRCAYCWAHGDVWFKTINEGSK